MRELTLSSNPLLFNRTLFDGLDLPEEPNVEGSIGGGGSLETYEQCVARRTIICHQRYNRDVDQIIARAILIGTLDATIAILVIGFSHGTLTGPTLFIAGLIALGVAVVTAFDISSARDRRGDCLADAPEGCRGLP